MTENKEAEAKVAQLQVLQQNMQTLMMQKQQFQLQANETESAIGELKNAQRAYKIVGSIMVLSTSAEIEKELAEKKQTTELRMKNIEAQEERLKKKAEELQKDIMQAFKKEK